MATSAMLIWFGSVALFMQYAATRPRNPEPTNGRIYSINNHGAIAYLNASENLRLWLLPGLALTLFFAALAIDRWASKSN
jgi:hypothetical protein